MAHSLISHRPSNSNTLRSKSPLCATSGRAGLNLCQLKREPVLLQINHLCYPPCVQYPVSEFISYLTPLAPSPFSISPAAVCYIMMVTASSLSLILRSELEAGCEDRVTSQCQHVSDGGLTSERRTRNTTMCIWSVSTCQ